MTPDTVVHKLIIKFINHHCRDCHNKTIATETIFRVDLYNFLPISGSEAMGHAPWHVANGDGHPFVLHCGIILPYLTHRERERVRVGKIDQAATLGLS